MGDFVAIPIISAKSFNHRKIGIIAIACGVLIFTGVWLANKKSTMSEKNEIQRSISTPPPGPEVAKAEKEHAEAERQRDLEWQAAEMRKETIAQTGPNAELERAWELLKRRVEAKVANELDPVQDELAWQRAINAELAVRISKIDNEIEIAGIKMTGYERKKTILDLEEKRLEMRHQDTSMYDTLKQMEKWGNAAKEAR